MSSVKNLSNNSHSEPNTKDSELFRSLVLRYSEIGANEGIRVIPFASPEMPFFQKASTEDQKNAINFMQTLVGIHEETLAAGERSINTKQLLWRALSRLSLIPGNDIFDRFTDEDCVLVYQANQTIIFWNLQFFRYSSLSVEHMLLTPWYEVTKRAPEIQKSLYDLAVDIISGKVTGVFTPKVPRHVVEELNTPECLKTWMEIP